MKTSAALWLPLSIVLATCASKEDDTTISLENNDSDQLEDTTSTNTATDDLNDDDSGTTTDSSSSQTGETSGDTGSGTSGDTGSGTSGDTGSGTSGDTGSGTSGDTGSGTSGDTGSGTSGDTGSGTSGDTGGSSTGDTGGGTSIPPDTDTNQLEGFGCNIPEGMLEPQNEESAYVIVDFGGIINDPEEESPTSGKGNFSIKLRGEILPLQIESMTAYYSFFMHGVVIKAYSVPDPTTGNMVFLEVKIATSDLIEMYSSGQNHMDIFELPSGNSSPTNVRVYEGRRDQAGNVEQLCLSAVPGTMNEGTQSGLWPMWICDQSISWTDNVGNDFGMAGNLAMFDDIDYIKSASGMRCVCPNGAGSWRNCDEGTPGAYGLLKFNFKSGAEDDDWFSRYIYDESMLVNENGTISTPAMEQHPEGVWQNYWSPILGGLNIAASGTDPTDGHTIYRFANLITPQSNATVIGLVSKDSTNNRFVIRQQSFDANDLTGNTMNGYWINAYLPGNISPGESIAFGTGQANGKLFIYDPNNNNCILAVACSGDVRIQETSENLNASEGGKLHLKTELDAYDTRQSVQLWHPSELPDNCNWETYLSESLQPTGIAICDKI